MHLALWILAGVTAFAFTCSGILKLVQPDDDLVAAVTGGWEADSSSRSIKLIGVAEILAAIGLILPAMPLSKPALIPLAVVGRISVMVVAAIAHARRHESSDFTIPPLAS